jgi:tetratricopeptide (TPR) repeat protein
MTAADFTFLLNKPDAVNDRQTAALEEIVTQFPYFQSARALRLKGLYNQNSFQYNYALKVAAAYTTDRSVLFDFITSDTFTAIHKGLYDQKVAELYGIEVEGSIEVRPEIPAAPPVDKLEESILSLIRESETPFDFTLDSESEEEIEIEEAEIAPEEIIPEEIVPEEIKPETIDITSNSVSTPEIPDADSVMKTIETSTPEITTPEEKLELGKPLEFTKSETHSFQEWLQLSRIQPIVRDEPAPAEEPASSSGMHESKIALIDRFIETNPKIPKINQEVKPVAVQAQKDDHTALMTETLARVYLEQKKYQKAIQAYEILILKYPEKSSFFADRISEIKNLQQNITQ